MLTADSYHGVWASLVKGLGGVTSPRRPSTPALSQGPCTARGGSDG